MDICALSSFILGCKICDIEEYVILAPCWSPQSVGITSAVKISDNTCEVWKCEENGIKFTYIVAGVGAFSSADIIRALNVTTCHRILLFGSAGALDYQIEIGDLAVPNQTICGEGASRYHQETLANDMFGVKMEVNLDLHKKILDVAIEEAMRTGIACHVGTAISVESIYSQFSFVEDFVNVGCKFIDMEASACMTAANRVGIPICIVFCISDNVMKDESLVSVSIQKTEFRKIIRLKTMPQIIRAFLE